MKDLAHPPALCPNRPAIAEQEDWIERTFSSPAVHNGGVIKRNLDEVEWFVGRERFLSEVKRRGFQALENGNALVVFCNTNPVRLAQARPPVVLH